jgi:hypothetical protein
MRRFASLLLIGCAAFAMSAASSGFASTGDLEMIIHNFAGTTGTGPEAGPVTDASTGAYYGTTAGAGANKPGVVYQLLPPLTPRARWTYKVIYNNSQNSEPVNASAYLYASNGVVYGAGFTSGGSVIFSLTPPKSGAGDWIPTILYTFTGGSDGVGPEGPLTIDAQGTLYGTSINSTTACQSKGECGTVFKLAPPPTQSQSWTFSILYSFPGGAPGENPPNGVIFDKQGNLYGSAPFDYPSSKSLIFKLTPPAGAGQWKESILYRFYPTSNCYSGGPLAIDANGALYGAFSGYATVGGCNDTANEYVFRLAPSESNPDVWVKTELRTFTNSNQAAGYGLEAPLTVDSSGNVYGANLFGGTLAAGSRYGGGGTVFVLQPQPGVPGKWNYKALFNFDPESGTKAGNSAGNFPKGGFAFDSGGLLGATSGGGSGNRGTIFLLKP